MEKKVFVAILLSIMILFVYDMMIYKGARNAPPPVPSQDSQMIKEETSPQAIVDSSLQIIRSKLSPVSESSWLIIDTDLARIKLTSEGEISSWELKRFKESSGQITELLQKDLPTALKIGVPPCVLTLIDRKISDTYVKEFIYEIEGFPQLCLKKQIQFYPDRYVTDVNFSLENTSDTYVTLPDNYGLTLNWTSAEKERASSPSPSQAVSYNKGKLQPIAFKNIGIMDSILASLGLKSLPTEDDIQRYNSETTVDWIANKGQYFLTILIPQKPVYASFIYKRKEKALEMKIKRLRFIIPPKGCSTFDVAVYVGPKDYSILQTLSIDAEKLAGLNILSRIILTALNFLHLITHSYGLSIILVTLIMKVFCYPLTLKNLRMMKAMQQLQPQLELLKKQYKDDKEGLSKEMMELYRKNKVNPLGGCLPLLLQMPIFFALYTTLTTAIALRGSKFLWCPDLSEKDPFFILPILMGISMFIQQKKSSVSLQDPAQAKIMMFLPIIFTFMFFGFPSGLVIYWVCYNIFSIGEQIIVEKIRAKKCELR